MKFSIILEGITFYNQRLYDLNQKNGKGWKNANSIPNSYLKLNTERVIKVCFSFTNSYNLLMESTGKEVLVQNAELKEVENIDFTCESNNPPIISHEILRIEDHICYGDFLINIYKLKNKEGLSGYSLQFASQEKIYIVADEDFIFVESKKPEGYWENRISSL